MVGEPQKVHQLQIKKSKNLAAYLVSDYSAYVNGEVVTIDGAEWVHNAGEFNKLSKVPKSAWTMLEKMTRKKKS